jgi:hypothetical protein
MKKSFLAIMGVFLVYVGWAPSLMAMENAKARPVEFRACNFREGKNMQDLEKVNAKFRDYANKNDSGYAAWVLTPEFQSDDGFDVGWLGSWPNGEAYGVSTEKWKSPQNALLPQFSEVIDCGHNHQLAWSLPINAPEGTPEDGILLFYQCTLNDGKSINDAYKAQLQFGQTMKAKGSLSVSWMFVPAAGAGDIDFDYYHVVGFYRYSDLGDTMELFVNRGGLESRGKIIDPVASCRTPNVYDALSVRAHDER